MTTPLIIPATTPPKNPGGLRLELACLAWEICSALANWPHLLDDLGEADQRLWRSLASATAEVALSQPQIVRFLLPADQNAILALIESPQSDG